jgi:phosphatidylglycerol:prolipoprotein diacylglycerol transferase
VNRSHADALDETRRPPGPLVIIHAIFDILAWLAAALCYRMIGGMHAWPDPRRTGDRKPYYAALVLGSAIGGIGFGTLNAWVSGYPEVARSIEGALVGGICGVELFKRAHGITGSTGARLALPLAIGIAIGRIGCFLAGLEDFTYGTPTGLPWGHDFGDGIPRHPVQLYESLAMLGFAMAYGVALRHNYQRFIDQGFYAAIGWYGLQRFLWEFLKPYEPVLGPANVFHILSAGLFAYAVIMVWGGYAGSRVYDRAA